MSDPQDDPEAKAGAAINAANRARVQAMHDHSVAMGAACAATGHDYTPIGNAKGQTLNAEQDAPPVFATVKALGDRTLELHVSYGYDAHGERFSAKTDFDTENFPNPPVLYYHGYDERGKPMGKPVVIGSTFKRESRSDAHVLTCKLRSNQYADKTWQAALAGNAVVSPGTAGHLRRKASDGELTYWPIVEISAWDYAEHRKPAHPHSIAIPVLKALYLSEGLDLPPSLSKEPPEAAGDAVSAESSDSGHDISQQEAEQVVAETLSAALLALRKGTP